MANPLVLRVSRERGNRSGLRGTRPTLPGWSQGEANEFANDFCRICYRGFWIFYDDN
jgi:hypothetical protein